MTSGRQLFCCARYCLQLFRLQLKAVQYRVQLSTIKILFNGKACSTWNNCWRNAEGTISNQILYPLSCFTLESNVNNLPGQGCFSKIHRPTVDRTDPRRPDYSPCRSAFPLLCKNREETERAIKQRWGSRSGAARGVSSGTHTIGQNK